MEKVKTIVHWCDKNFGGTFGDEILGGVAFTAKTFDELQRVAAETLRFHVEGLLADGENIPRWLAEGDYELEYHYVDTATLLRAYEPYVTFAAISRASGINKGLLSHYANGRKHPRQAQKERLLSGLHKIGKELQSVTL